MRRARHPNALDKPSIQDCHLVLYCEDWSKMKLELLIFPFASGSDRTQHC